MLPNPASGFPTRFADPAEEAARSSRAEATNRVVLTGATEPIPPEPQAFPAPPAAVGSAPSVLPGPATSARPLGGSPPITLHADDLDVRKTLEILSRQAGLNILVSPGVGGRVTIDLRDTTIDEALKALARLCDLMVQREKDVIYVLTPEELRQGDGEEFPVRVYHLNYVKSSDLEKMIQPLLSPRGAMTCSPDSEVGIKTSADKAGGDAMAGGETVIVQDCEQVLKTVDRIVAQIDVQPVQVVIEAVILQVTLTKSMELGINASLLDGVIGGTNQALGVVGNGSLINPATGFTPAQVLSTSGALASGFAGNTSGLKFGSVGGNTTAFIQALETLADTKVLASPRLLVLNKQRAEIQLGDRLGYQTVTQDLTSTVQQVQFMDVGTLLRLRPFVRRTG
jgi:type II secretory pathway component GspD/PulD (secretin)